MNKMSNEETNNLYPLTSPGYPTYMQSYSLTPSEYPTYMHSLFWGSIAFLLLEGILAHA